MASTPPLDALEPTLETYRFFEHDWDSHEQLCDAFEWEVPKRFNMVTYLLDRWSDARPDRVALYTKKLSGEVIEHTYADLQAAASRLANFLEDRGVGRGDRIAVNGSQKVRLLVGHLAAWKLGAVSVPLSILYGPDGLGFRLRDSGAKAFLVDEQGLGSLRAVRDELDELETVITVDADPGDDEVAYEDALAGQPDQFETVPTDPEDRAMLIYTSGTTGPPKGVVHAHRGFLGILPGFVTSLCNMKITDEDVFRGPVEWSWVGSLNDVILPGLYYGIPFVAYAREQFDPVEEFQLLEEFDVTLTGGPATIQRMMMQVPDPAERFDLTSVRCMIVGGEALGETIVDWVHKVYDDLTIHEVYGQTESPLFVGDCEALGVPHRVGSMGKTHPGHQVRILDPETHEFLPDGEVGEIALNREGDPEVMQAFWNNPTQTEKRFHEGWLLTEDMGTRAEDGYFTFHSRKDDVIISSGYRIGPEEIEETITGHEAVANAGVIGVPDEQRGEIPKAFVVLAEGFSPTDALKGDLQAYVKDRLARYEYPRALEFVDELPRTSTGKVRRQDLRDRERS